MRSSQRGCLYLVVGPSGVGKDTLLDMAREHFAVHPDYSFPVRVITRPLEAGGEVHDAVTVEQFDSLLNTRAFSLHWAAHDLRYGIRRTIEDDLAGGKNVVINVSRSILDDARGRFQPLRIVSITASPETLAARLAARGRETKEDQIARLWRSVSAVAGDDVIEVDNDQPLEISRRAFLAALSA